MYQQLNGKIDSSEKPGTEESRRFWSNIQGPEKSHNKNDEWLKQLRAEQNEIKPGNIKKNTEMVTQQTTKVSSWKCPGPDRVPVYGVIHYQAFISVSLKGINDRDLTVFN